MADTIPTNQARPNQKWLTIKTGTGRVTGYIEGFLNRASGRYVTIPGVSRYCDPDDPENLELVASLEFAAVAERRNQPRS